MEKRRCIGMVFEADLKPRILIKIEYSFGQISGNSVF